MTNLADGITAVRLKVVLKDRIVPMMRAAKAALPNGKISANNVALTCETMLDIINGHPKAVEFFSLPSSKAEAQAKVLLKLHKAIVTRKLLDLKAYMDDAEIHKADVELGMALKACKEAEL